MDCYCRFLQVIPDSEDPVIFLQVAARDHVPISPKGNRPLGQLMHEPHSKIPIPADRHSIDEALDELQQADWYKDQIVVKRSFLTRRAEYGKLLIYSFSCKFQHRFNLLVPLLTIDNHQF